MLKILKNGYNSKKDEIEEVRKVLIELDIDNHIHISKVDGGININVSSLGGRTTIQPNASNDVDIVIFKQGE